jgi:cell division protein FtsI/penicillin-binding protein 2
LESWSAMGLPGGAFGRDATGDPADPDMPAGVRGRRVTLMSAVVITMMLAVLGRLWQLQVVNGPAYAQAAAAAHVRTVPLPAPGGGILTADGRPLATGTHHGALAGSPGDGGSDALHAALEVWYGDALAGGAGLRTVSVNSRGAVTRVLSERPPLPGRSLVTSVDGRVQLLAEQALAQTSSDGGAGSVVVLEASTGRVIALAGHAVQPRPRPGESLVMRAVPAAMAAELGLTGPTGIDLPGEQPGGVTHPDMRQWLGPGRAYVVLTGPLQLARACAAAANGGTLFSPRVARALVRVDGRASGTTSGWAGRVITPPVAGRVSPATLRLVRGALTGPSSGGHAAAPGAGVVTGPDWSASFGPRLRYVVVVVASRGDAGAAESAARRLQQAIAGLGGAPGGTADNDLAGGP